MPKNNSRIWAIFILLLQIKFAIAATQEQEIIAPDVKILMHQNVTADLKPHLVFKTKKDAKAWFKDMSHRLARFVPNARLRKEYLTVIQYEAARAGLDPQLVLSVITVESKFKKYALSKAGAKGLMQVMPFWVDLVGDSKQSLFDVETNIRYGCTILRYYIQVENGSLSKALARYNGSSGKTWYPELVYQAHRRYWMASPILTIESGELVYVNYIKDNPIFNFDDY